MWQVVSSENSGLPTGPVSAIVMARGVGRFDGVAWTCFDAQRGLRYDSAASLTAEPRGNVWCAHMLGDISLWDGRSWSFLPGGEGGRPKENLDRATEDRHGRLCFPTRVAALVYTP